MGSDIIKISHLTKNFGDVKAVNAGFILFGKIVWHMVDFGVSVKTAADINRLIRNRKRKD